MLIATPETAYYMDGVPVDRLEANLLRPVRTIADRGGKSWRCAAAGAAGPAARAADTPRVRVHPAQVVRRARVHGHRRRRQPRAPELARDARVHARRVPHRGRHPGRLAHAARRPLRAPHLRRGRRDQRGHRRVLHGHENDLGPAHPTAADEPVRRGPRESPGHNTPLAAAAPRSVYELYFAGLRAGHAGQALDIAGLDYLMDDAIKSGDGATAEKRILAIHRLKTGAPPPPRACAIAAPACLAMGCGRARSGPRWHAGAHGGHRGRRH